MPDTTYSAATDDLYQAIPEIYRVVDKEQKVYQPLRKYLEGPGSLMSTVRDLYEGLEAGALTTPDLITDPQAALWLAQMMGVDVRSVTWEQALDDLRSRISEGVPAVGTYSHVAARARIFLNRDGDEDPQIEAMPGPDDWEIALVVRADSVPGSELDEFIARVQASPAVPAGFFIRAYLAEATWDQFDAAKGQTWAEFTMRIKTWAQHDSVGTVLDDVE